MPYLSDDGHLMVDGKPYLMLAGELHNSTTGSVHNMEPVWKKMADLNINTVFVAVSWELLEPEENLFNFTLVDEMIRGCREADLKLVLLWFGSWKNGRSTYAPAWVKTDQKRFPLVCTKDGAKSTTLSTLGKHTLEADSRAFSRLMNHLKEVDGKENTVIMVPSVLIEVLDGEDVLLSSENPDGILTIADAKLWDAENPNLYTLRVSVYDKEGIVRDVECEKYGIRQITWDRYGLYVNGRSVLLKGGCLHSDNGIVGAEEYREFQDRKVRILKEYGFNAIRSAHNPCSEELMQACDSLGMYIIDELWDMWFKSKNPNDYGKYFMDNYRNDLVAIVEKDFNHPSVIMYSIGNEISEPTAPGGLEITKDIVSRLHGLDPDRPVTGGMNTIILGSGAGRSTMMGSGDDVEKKEVKAKERKSSSRSKKSQREYVEPEVPEGGLVSFADMFRSGSISSEEYNQLVQQHILTDDYMIMGRELDSIITPALDELDIVGYNYATVRYPSEESRHPGRLVYGSETYPQDIWKNWEMVKEYPYVCGDFMWTAWDYIGECGIGAWSYGDRQRGYPYKLADCGALDLIGNPTGEAYWAKVTWEETPGNPYIAVRPVSEQTPRVSQWRGTNSVPSWTWKGKEGVNAVVEVFTSARRVKLYLNGELVGRARTENGILFKKGESSLRTAEGEERIVLRPELTETSEGKIVFVNVDIVAANGEICTYADNELKIDVYGGLLKGFGSGLPVTEARFDSGCYPAYYGQALAAVKAGNAGDLKITVSADDLDAVTVTIPIR